ncbi:MAG: hypothetical protein JNM56_35585 [Planctomycetia bacterium]|nr:hypothetical protein [Planctomycetia bacterium]
MLTIRRQIEALVSAFENRPTLCLECGQRTAEHPAGVCWACCVEQGESLDLDYAGRPLPALPTDSRPGSAERVAVYSARVASGRAVFHPRDRKDCEGLTGKPADPLPSRPLVRWLYGQTSNRVLKLLKSEGRPLAPAEVCELADICYDTAHGTLRRLCVQGLARRARRGQYEVA